MPEVLSHPSPAPESLPETPEVDAETVAEIDSIDQPEEPSFRERANKVADRISEVLEARLRAKQDQKDAYESYAENISATKTREKEERSQERKETAKKVLGKIGNFSLGFLESQGVIPLRGKWHKQGQGKFNMNFSAWVARKYVNAKQRRSERVAGFLSAEQNAAVAGEVRPPAAPVERSSSEQPTVEIPPVPADTTETPEPTPDTSTETETSPEDSTETTPETTPEASTETSTPADSETPAEPAEGEPHDEEYVERARREAEAAAQSAEEQRTHERDVV